MLPPGLSFNAISEKALAASRAARLPQVVLGVGADARRQRRTDSSRTRRPPICCSACAKRCACCTRKGCRRCSRGTAGWRRRPARPSRAWGLEIVCGGADEHSPVVTTVMMPEGHDCGRASAGCRRAVQPVARRRPRPAQGKRVPHRPPGRLQRADARRHAVRRRDGAGRSPACRSGAAAWTPRSNGWRSRPCAAPKLETER